MVIDFHTHAFDDKIAEKAIAKLKITCNSEPFSDGTINGLINLMKEKGIDKSVLLPIATKPSQQRMINTWAKEVESDKIISFGSVHPEAEDALDELERIKELGLKGVKLHPDYQDFFVEEERVFHIYKKCSELDLPIIFHSGFDPLSPNLIHATTDGFLEVIKNFSQLKIILAHLGGRNFENEVLEKLCGISENVYLDTALVCCGVENNLFERIINKHGSDKILFASDNPWSDPLRQVNQIKALNISDEDKDKILYKNAKKLLGI